MIGMAVGHQNPFDVFKRNSFRRFGIGDPGVDQKSFPPSRRILKGGMPQPAQFRLHRVRPFSDGKGKYDGEKNLFHWTLLWCSLCVCILAPIITSRSDDGE